MNVDKTRQLNALIYITQSLVSCRLFADLIFGGN